MTATVPALRLVDADEAGAEATPPPLPPLATAADIASELHPEKELGAAKQLIYTAVREHGLPVIRFGRALRFDRNAVREWMANGGTAPKDDA